MSHRLVQRSSRVAGEFVLIIVGVLSALAVDQWRDSRQDRQLEREYLDRLEADLIETREAINNTIEAFRGFVAHGVAVSRVLDGSKPFPADTLGFLASALQVSRGGYDPAVSRAAWDDLISTGNLRLLRNERLRFRLSEFYGGVQNDLSPIDYSADKMPYRNTVRGLLPLEIQLLIRAECDGAEPLTCPDYDGEGGFRQTVMGIVADPRIRPQLTVTLQGMAIRSLESGVTGGFTSVLRQIDELLVLLHPADSRTE